MTATPLTARAPSPGTAVALALPRRRPARQSGRARPVTRTAVRRPVPMAVEERAVTRNRMAGYTRAGARLARAVMTAVAVTFTGLAVLFATVRHDETATTTTGAVALVAVFAGLAIRTDPRHIAHGGPS